MPEEPLHLSRVPTIHGEQTGRSRVSQVVGESLNSCLKDDLVPHSEDAVL